MAKTVVRKKNTVEKIEKKLTSPKTSEKFSNKINLNNKSYTPILLVLLLVASFLLGALSTKIFYMEKAGQGTSGQTGQTGTQGSPPNQIPSPGAKVNVDNGHLPILGKKDAKVTVIEFADFQCPFCERFFKDTVSNLKKDYVDTGKVKFVFRHYAFLGQESTWAAQASECANEQGKFWGYHDYLYNHQGPENSGAFAKDKLIGFAQSIGLNADQFSSCLNSEKYAKNVSDDLAGGQKAGVTGTPATFINGQLVVGAQPYTAFKTIIDGELKKAK